MPIYEYRCSNCGFQKEFLQKVSDPPHTVCPQCGQEAFSKMLTAAGFQLKGSGWYVTDFRGKGSGGGGASKPSESKSDKPAGEAKPGGESSSGESKATPAPAPSAPSTSSSEGKAGS